MSKDKEPSTERKRTLAEKLHHAEKVARQKAIKEREQFRGLQIRPTATLLDGKPARQPGDTNWSRFGFDLHPQVSFISGAILAVFIFAAVMFQDQAKETSDAALAWISGNFGWFFILSANIFIGAALFFAFSGLGKIRIGGKDAQPEFSTQAWLAMLLSAGMGIGLMFWSVGEPMYHYSSPSPMFEGIFYPSSPP